MENEFEKKDKIELLILKATYQEIIKDEPDTTMADFWRGRIAQVNVALAKKDNSLLG